MAGAAHMGLCVGVQAAGRSRSRHQVRNAARVAVQERRLEVD
jgi:hypothetical protein